MDKTRFHMSLMGSDLTFKVCNKQSFHLIIKMQKRRKAHSHVSLIRNPQFPMIPVRHK